MIRKALVKDVKDIQALINRYAKQDKMLPRSLNEIYENIRDFFVYESDGNVVGCVALHVAWEDLAEIKSLAVAEKNMGRKIGSRLIEKVLEDAKNIGLKKIFTLTYVPEFFEKAGFKKIEHSGLPHKIWSECIKCVKFPNCEEIALVKDVT